MGLTQTGVGAIDHSSMVPAVLIAITRSEPQADDTREKSATRRLYVRRVLDRHAGFDSQNQCDIVMRFRGRGIRLEDNLADDVARGVVGASTIRQWRPFSSPSPDQTPKPKIPARSPLHGASMCDRLDVRLHQLHASLITIRARTRWAMPAITSPETRNARLSCARGLAVLEKCLGTLPRPLTENVQASYPGAHPARGREPEIPRRRSGGFSAKRGNLGSKHDQYELALSRVDAEWKRRLPGRVDRRPRVRTQDRATGLG